MRFLGLQDFKVLILILENNDQIFNFKQVPFQNNFQFNCIWLTKETLCCFNTVVVIKSNEIYMFLFLIQIYVTFYSHMMSLLRKLVLYVFCVRLTNLRKSLHMIIQLTFDCFISFKTKHL